jgi:hypothetical protein
LNDAKAGDVHLSLPSITADRVPHHVHCYYQWPRSLLPISNTTHIDGDNLLIAGESINIFWWKAKLLKPEELAASLQYQEQDD